MLRRPADMELKDKMNERFLEIRTAMKEAIQEGVSCGACEQPIFGPKVTILLSSIPREGEVPRYEVMFKHRECEGGGELNG